MNSFFQTVKHAIVSPVFYDEVLATKKSAFTYFFKLIALTSLAFTLLMSIWLLPLAGSVLTEFGTKAIAMYPADLIVEYANGEISTNQKEPYAIPAPRSNNGHAPLHRNLVVIDTAAEPDIDTLDAHDTYILLTKDSAVFRDEQSRQVRIQQLGVLGGQEFTISRTVVSEVVQRAIPIIRKLAPFLVVLIYFVSFLASLGLLLYALFGALVVMLIARLKNRTITYDRAYHATIYLLTLPILVNIVLRAVSFTELNIPPVRFLTTIIVAVLAVIHIKSLPPAPVAELPKQHHEPTK